MVRTAVTFMSETAPRAKVVGPVLRSGRLTMPNDTILCGRPGSSYCVTVGDYKAWENEAGSGWSKKPEFIRRRLFERYIDPVKALDCHPDTKRLKNGFYIMAVSCLLIETLVSYWRGWETTEPHKDAAARQVPGKSREAFRIFFHEEGRFAEFQGTEFYKRIRCGILHQGEATGGWTISREGSLFDGTSEVNATKFHNKLAAAIRDYESNLKNPLPGSSLRNNFDKKMKAVIANCR
jgi:hypothetical protein